MGVSKGGFLLKRRSHGKMMDSHKMYHARHRDTMDAERQNQIIHHIEDCLDREAALRRYL